MENVGFKRINRAYEQFVNSSVYPPMSDIPGVPDQLLQSFISVIRTCSPDLKLNLFTDLFHMHINRLFSDNQRIHEMVIYSFLNKQLLREYKNTQLLVQIDS